MGTHALLAIIRALPPPTSIARHAPSHPPVTSSPLAPLPARRHLRPRYRAAAECALSGRGAAGAVRRVTQRQPLCFVTEGQPGKVAMDHLDMNQTGTASWRGQCHDPSLHARQCTMFYRNDRLAWDRQAYRQPVGHSRSEPGCPCPTHTRRVRPLPGVSRTCVEAASKTSSACFSTQDLWRTRSDR